MPAVSSIATAHRPSPNCRARKEGETLRYVILHGTWMTSDEEALERLTNPLAEVSAHYYISRGGTCTGLVSESDVAWHAGKSEWQGETGLNAYSIGIEIGNAGPFMAGPPLPEEENTIPPGAPLEPYTKAQISTLVKLLKDILKRNPTITPQNILGHNQVSPGRKTDPGPHFPWQAIFSELGLS